MEIQVKLMGMLRRKSPPGDKLELPEGATILQALAALDIAAEQVQVVLINDLPQRDKTQPLQPGDQMTVLALVGGG